MKKHLAIFLLLSFTLLPISGEAAPIRYIDESGNIYWVESPLQVPQRYRYQLVAPTPTISGKGRKTSDPAYKEWLRAKRAKEKEQKRLEKERKKEEKEAEKERKKEEKERKRKKKSRDPDMDEG